MAVTERFSPLRLSPQHNPAQPPHTQFPGAGGVLCGETLQHHQGSPEPKTVLSHTRPALPAPTPVQGALKALQTCLSPPGPGTPAVRPRPPGRSSPPANHHKAGKASARPIGRGRRLFFPEARSSPRGRRSQGWWAGFWPLRAVGRGERPTDKVRPRARVRAAAVGRGETHSVCRGTREKR